MGKFIGHESCPKCTKANLSRYDDGGATCETAGCGYWEGKSMPEGRNYKMDPAGQKKLRRLEMTGTVQAIPDRKLSQATCAKFGVTCETSNNRDGKGFTITKHHYPLYDVTTKAIVGTKVRVVSDKSFYHTGTKENTGLFGQNTCKGKGKFITITEGEIDAMAVSEMFENKWDVVSLSDGAGPQSLKCLQNNLEFLEGYDSVVFCFDNDKAGKIAVDACKDLFSPGKLKICELPMKDAGAMLQARKIRDFTRAWWDAKPYRPDGIVRVSETLDDVIKYCATPMHPYPYRGLTDMLMGQRSKEIVIWAADTGVGKSQLMRELQNHLIETTEENVGCLMLEECVAKTTLGWMSFMAGRPLHKEMNDLNAEDITEYWEAAVRGDRLVLLDHKGWKNDLDTLKARIRYMAKSLGCRFIILDHLHIALSSVQGATGDWAGIDELMTEFVGLVQELDICLHLVCHTTGERSLRGSKGISKLADAVIFLERDKHNEDPEVANTTTMVVDKNRWGGDQGIAGYLFYDKFTGRMTEIDKPAGMDGGVPDEF